MKKILLFLLISLSISFFFQGKRGLWEPDEGRYTEASREMILTNNYLIPKLNLEPHLSKPPVTYWLIAFSLKKFGENEFSARLPNSFFFFLTTLVILFLSKRLFGWERAIISSIIYSTSIFPFAGLNFITTDTILTFFIWLYILFYFLKRFYLMSFFMGIAFLTKGPPSLLPFFGILIYHLFFKKIRFQVKKVSISLLIFLITGLWWYIYIVIHDPSKINYFINYELIGRIKGIHHRNEGPFMWLMYFPILFFGLLPWQIFFYKDLKKVFNENPKVLFFIIFVPFIIFCLSKSRLPLYLLPLMPAVAIIGSVNVKNFEKISIITAIFLIIARLILAYIPYSKDDKRVYSELKKIIKSENFVLCFVTSRVWNGLNFYFKKIPEYLSLDKSKKLNRFCKKTVNEKLVEISKSHRKTFILISDIKKAKIFEKLVKRGYKKYKTENFYVYEFN